MFLAQRTLPFLLSAALLSSLAARLPGAEKIAQSASVFVRAHRESPIDWMTWGPDAVARAQKENKPLYLAIGSFGSELSRAMNRQTFSNAQVAALLNAEFVCVLVDRDEHPAVAAFGQAFVSTKKQLTGWPVNLWLTPELKPFEGATYLPPSEEWGKEGYMNVAQRAVSLWKGDAEAQRQKGDDALAEIRDSLLPVPEKPLSREALNKKLAVASAAWLQQLDTSHGGFGEAPRYPEAELLRFLLTQDEKARNGALDALRALARGAVHDPIDGGFFRSTTDQAGRIASLLKTTTDQARLALAYLDAAALTDDPEFKAAARAALDFAYAQLRNPAGGYIAALDGSSDESRAAFAWSQEEIMNALGEKTGAEFSRVYGVVPAGNVTADEDPSGRLKGRNVLIQSVDDFAAVERLASARAKLNEVRAKRLTLVRDENVVCSTQGWMLAALTRAGQALKDPVYQKRARECAEFIQREFLAKDGALKRLAGSPAPAGAADYLVVAYAFALAGEPEGAQRARALSARAAREFLDPETGRWYVGVPQPVPLPLRPTVSEPLVGEPARASAVALWLAALPGTPAEGLVENAPLLERALASDLEDPASTRGDLLLAAAVKSRR